MKLIVNGLTYHAALNDIEPLAVTPVFSGCRVTLQAPDSDTWERWVDRMSEVADDLVGDGQQDTAEAIYKDIERNDLRMGRVKVA